MKTMFLLWLAVLVVMTMPPKSFADDDRKSAKMGAVNLRSQTGDAVIEVIKKADLNTMYFLMGDGLFWGLSEDFGGTGLDTVQLGGLNPGTTYFFRVMRRTVGIGGVTEAVASDTVIDTTWCQTRWGSDSCRTQWLDFTLAPPGEYTPGEQLLVGVVKPDSVAQFLSVVLFSSTPTPADTAWLEVTIADSAKSWSPYGFGGLVFWQGTIAVSGKGPFEVPIDLHSLDPFPNQPEPSRFWVTVRVIRGSTIIVSTAREGLDGWIKRNRGWQHHDSTGIVLAFGVELKKNTAVFPRPATAQPAGFELQQNYPNPFNPETNIGYELPEATRMTLKVYNMLGQEIATLVNGIVDAGEHQAIWNGGARPSGVYLCRMTAGNFSKTIPMALLK